MSERHRSRTEQEHHRLKSHSHSRDRSRSHHKLGSKSVDNVGRHRNNDYHRQGRSHMGNGYKHDKNWNETRNDRFSDGKYRRERSHARNHSHKNVEEEFWENRRRQRELLGEQECPQVWGTSPIPER